MLLQLRKGDVVVVWKLDHLARSIRDLIDLVNKMRQEEVDLNSLHDQVDTSTPQGKFTFHLFAAMAEFERNLISERTKSGLESACAQGHIGGRPNGLSQLKMSYQLRKSAIGYVYPVGLFTITCDIRGVLWCNGKKN